MGISSEQSTVYHSPPFFFLFSLLNDVRVSAVALPDARHRPPDDDDGGTLEFQHCHRHSSSEYPASLIFHCPRLLRRPSRTRHYPSVTIWITARPSKDCIRFRSSTGRVKHHSWRNPTQHGGDQLGFKVREGGRSICVVTLCVWFCFRNFLGFGLEVTLNCSPVGVPVLHLASTRPRRQSARRNILRLLHTGALVLTLSSGTFAKSSHSNSVN